MASAPPLVHRIAKEVFSISQEIHYDLLPSPMISIAKMLEFTVPLEFVPNGAPQPAQYFSKAAPDILDQNIVNRLRRLPIPEAKVIRKLVERSRQAWLDGYQSVIYSHLSGSVVTHFPLWVLTYWNAILDFKREVRAPWVKCSDWVAQQKKLARKNPARAELVEETGMILRMIPWGWAKPEGLSDSEPIHNLWRFLGPHWLTGSQQNDMLELLR
ncbi:hypothetical protein B0H10DRAFT_1770791, partial [Mycena sp. CBHHK59/15]